MPERIEHLFVYGTLRPGDVRWHFLAPYVLDEGHDDSTTGNVHDTGRGYPAAVFDANGTIHGRTYRLDRRRLDEALAVLDTEESSVPGGFTRVEITTDAGVRAWAYAYGSGLELTPIPGGDWLAR